MTTIAIVKECLLALGDRTGSSLYAMNKWIDSEKQVGSIRVSFWEELKEFVSCFRKTGTSESHT
jgi:hypothetical protein